MGHRKATLTRSKMTHFDVEVARFAASAVLVHSSLLAFGHNTRKRRDVRNANFPGQNHSS